MCSHCFVNLFPDDPKALTVRKKSEELQVVSYILSKFNGFIHDTPFYVGLEVSAGSWLPTLMQERTGSLETGAITGALFYLMFTIGRIVATPLSHKLSAETLLLGSVSLAFPVVLIAIFFDEISPFAIAAMGLLIGPVFAAASDWIAVRTPGDPLATTLLMLAAMSGALVLPPAAGFILQSQGASVLPIILAPILLVSLACFSYMIRHWRKVM